MASLATLTGFADVQRALTLFVRGLQTGPAEPPPVSLAPPGVRRAFANEHGLFFPASFSMLSGELGRQVFFASAAHLLAHRTFGKAPWQRGSLRPIQVVLASLFEDARVEALQLAALPGLHELWRPHHVARPSDHVTFPTLCARISRALFDARHQDEHPLVHKARALFWRSGALPSAEDCRRAGSLLGNDVGQTRLGFNQRDYAVEPVYRDDHRLLWQAQEQEDQPSFEHGQALDQARATRSESAPRAASSQAARLTPLRSEDHEKELETTGAVTQTVPTSPQLVRYPEYDYQIGISRPDFCTLREQVSSAAPKLRADAPHRTLPPALLRLAGALRLETRRRRSRERDGDQIDLEAALEARLDLRARRTPDDRVYVRTARKRQRLALLMLLDMSQSTADLVAETGLSLLALSRLACLQLADVMWHVGDPFAVHGFSSNGRHEVEYHRFKEFAEPWNQAVQTRLSALEPRLSTRMGTALRHGTRALADVKAERRLLLLLTDGEPADIDAPDPLYLLHDARHVVRETRRRDVGVFAVGLDPQGAPYLARIFGKGGYVQLPRLERLPHMLTELYARLHV